MGVDRYDKLKPTARRMIVALLTTIQIHVRQSVIALISFVFTIAFLASCTSTPETSQEAASPVSEPQPVAAPAPKAESSEDEEIIVTGRLIRRNRADAPTPVDVLSEDDASADSPSPQPAPAQELDRVSGRARDIETSADFKPEIISRRVDPSMVFKHYGVNPTIDTVEQNTSTFSIDVDTASYSISRGFLERGQLPDPAAVRVEEFVNAFDYGYQSPSDNLFSLQAEAFPSPYRSGFHVLHLGVKGADASQVKVKPSNLTFLIDVSGSMEQGQRLQTVKRALTYLLDELPRGDSISIVTYTDYATLVLEPTDVIYREKIIRAINSLHPQSNTNIQAGLEMAYQVANKSYHPEVNNRIILCSDGVANSGETNPEEMLTRISEAAQRGIYLNSIGVGMGNYNDVILETLAKRGQGQYAYINSYAEAKTLFGEALLSSLQVLAQDVRLQVEFDPAVVKSYRLLGYENRAMDNSDFNNAKKDAGEVGLGHSVTAVYEIKFQSEHSSSHFGQFRLAYKALNSEQLTYLDKSLPMSIVANNTEQASAASQLSYLVAAYAEKLRGSYWSRVYGYDTLENWLDDIDRQVPNRSQAKQLQQSMSKAAKLDRRSDPYEQRVSIRNMSFDRVPVLN